MSANVILSLSKDGPEKILPAPATIVV